MPALKATYGIMQGRLSPPEDGRFQSFPRECWRQEFPLAKTAGFDYIEWIVDAYGEDVNPIFTPEGQGELDALKAEYSVATSSICADWLMAYPLLRCTPSKRSEREQFLHRIIPNARRMGAQYVVLPFVDSARIVTDEEKQAVVEILSAAAPVAADNGIGLHLETDLNARDFAALLTCIPHPSVHANFDSGNSAGLGYIASEEFAAYGERIGSIHIKDRYRKPEGGIETRPLGQGSADFEDIFAAIRSVHYAGGLTLEVARGEPGDEVNFIRQQLAFLQRFLT